MAFPAVRSRTETPLSSGTSLAIDFSQNAGDLVVIFLALNDTAQTITTSESFVNLTNISATFHVIYKVLDGTEGTSTTVTVGSSTKGAAIAYNIRTGTHDPAKAPAISTVATGTSNSPDSGSLSPAGGADEYLWISAFRQNGEEANDDTWVTGVPTTPGTFTNLVQTTSGTTQAASTNGSVASAEYESNVSTLDPGNFTTAQSLAWRAYTLAIYPLLETYSSNFSISANLSGTVSKSFPVNAQIYGPGIYFDGASASNNGGGSTTLTADFPDSIAEGDVMVMAVTSRGGTNEVIRVSTTMPEWDASMIVSEPSDTGGSGNGIRYGNCIWMLYANPSSGTTNFYTSPTGRSDWTEVSGLSGIVVQGLEYINGYWVAWGYKSSSPFSPQFYFSSDDGETWSSAQEPFGSSNGTIAGIRYGNSYWVALTSLNGIWTATALDGTWTSRWTHDQGSSSMKDLAGPGNGGWVAVGESATILSCGDDPTGTWSHETTFESLWSNSAVNAAIWANNIWIVAGYYGWMYYNTTNTGTWTGLTPLTNDASHTIYNVWFEHGRWMLVFASPTGYLATSPGRIPTGAWTELDPVIFTPGGCDGQYWLGSGLNSTPSANTVHVGGCLLGGFSRLGPKVDSSTTLAQQLFWKIVDADDVTAGSTTVMVDPSAKASCVVVSVKGASTDLPRCEQYGGQANASSQTVTAPALGTWSSTKGLDLGFFGTAYGSSFTPPTDYQEAADGASTPADNTATTTEGAYRALTATTVGSISATAANAAVNIGHHLFLKQSLATVSGSFTAQAVLAKTLSTGFGVSAVLSKTQTASFPVEYQWSNTHFGSFFAQAVIKASSSFSFPVQYQWTTLTTYLGSFPAAASLRGTISSSFPVDAISLKEITATAAVNAVVERTATGSFAVQYQWITGFHISANITQTYRKLFNVAANIAWHSFSVAATIKASPSLGFGVAAEKIPYGATRVSASAPLNAQLLGPVSSSFPVDAVVRVPSGSFVLEADIRGQNEQRGSFSMSAILGRRTTKIFALNGQIGGNGFFSLRAFFHPLPFSIAAYIALGSGSGNFGVAAVRKRTASTIGFPINADLKGAGEVRVTFPVDATLKRTMSSGVEALALRVDASIVAKPFPTFALDAFLVGTMYRSLPLDAYIRGNNIVIYPEDGIGTITVISGGSGYTDTPTVVFGGPGAGAVAVPIVTGGVITGFVILNGGSGYTESSTVTISGGGGAGADIEPIVSGGMIVGLVIVSGGSGYASGPAVTITDPTGSGASAVTVVSGGEVTAIVVTNPGSGYTSPSVDVTGPATASATTSNQIGPIGPSGNILPAGYAATRQYRIEITVGGTEVTGDVIWSRTSFTQYAKTGPGTFEIVLNGAFTFTGGEEVTVDIDGIRTFGGYVLQIEYGYAFEANATPLTTLRGADYNLIFDRALIYNKPYLAEYFAETGSRGGEYINWLSFAKGTLDTTIINKVFSDYVDLPDGFNFTDHVTSVGSVATEVPWVLPTAGSTLRKVMQSISQVTNAVWWIDANKCLWYTDRTTVTAPYPITDGLGGITAREVSLTSDMSQLVTEDWLWGTLARTTSGDIMVSHHEHPESLATYGHWQYGEERTEIHHASWLSKRAGSVISRYGLPLHRANATIYDPGFIAGMVANVKLDAHGLNENLVIREVSLDFVVGKAPVGEIYYGLPRYRLTMGLDPETPWNIYDYLPYPDEEKGRTVGTSKRSDVDYRRFWADQDDLVWTEVDPHLDLAPDTASSGVIDMSKYGDVASAGATIVPNESYGPGGEADDAFLGWDPNTHYLVEYWKYGGGPPYTVDYKRRRGTASYWAPPYSPYQDVSWVYLYFLGTIRSRYQLLETGYINSDPQGITDYFPMFCSIPWKLYMVNYGDYQDLKNPPDGLPDAEQDLHNFPRRLIAEGTYTTDTDQLTREGATEFYVGQEETIEVLLEINQYDLLMAGPYLQFLLVIDPDLDHLVGWTEDSLPPYGFYGRFITAETSPMWPGSPSYIGNTTIWRAFNQLKLNPTYVYYGWYYEGYMVAIDGWNTETHGVFRNTFETKAKVTPYTASLYDQTGLWLEPEVDWQYVGSSGRDFWVKDGVTRVTITYLALAPFLNVNRPTPRSPRGGKGGHRPI